MKILDVKNASTPTQNKNETINDTADYNQISTKNQFEIFGIASINADDVSKIALLSPKDKSALKKKILQLDLRKIFAPDRQHKGFICPNCGNGLGKDGDGVTVNFDDSDGRFWYHCFKGNDFEGTLIKILDKITNGDFNQTLAIGKKLLDLAEKSKVQPPPPRMATEISPAEIALIKKDITDAQKCLAALPIKDRRGLTLDTLRKFGVGYLADLIHPKHRLEGKEVPASPRIIIPTSDISYNAILVDSARTADNLKYKSQAAGAKEIFNAAAITTGEPVIVVEGEIDAMSIWQASGVKVVALGGTSNTGKFIQLLNETFSESERINFNFVVILDNDNSGRERAAEFINALHFLGYPATAKFFADSAEKIDANQILQQHGGDALKAIVENIITDALIELSAAREEISKHKINASDDERQAELFADLQAVKKKIAEFDATSKAAIELLKDVETFTSDIVFSDKIVEAAAYANLFDKQAYSDFARALKNYGDKHPVEKVTLNDWKATVKDKAASISNRRANLAAQLTKIQATIDTEKFFAENPDVNFSRPADFSITNDGVYKIDGEKSILACRRPVIICAKTKSVEDKTFKPILQYWKANGKRVTLPPMPAATVFNRASVVNLADFGLPISSYTSTVFVGYLDAFNALNEDTIPLTYTVPRCGWYTFDDTDIFVDPRRENTISDDGVTCPLVVDNSSQFANNLTQKGTLENWRKAYELAKSSPTARAIVAACVAAPLLKVLGERNFLLYIKAHTRAGKTTALTLGASCVGNEKIIRTFDATKNGLLGAAADVNDFSFLVDEKQVTDNRLAEQFQLIIYALANGIGRTKLNYDSTLKKTADWRTIAVLTGETNLLEDNATGGAYTRLLQLNAPKIILSADSCKEIRRIVRDNYGLLIPRIIDKVFEYGFEILRGYYDQLQNRLAKNASDILPEYRRYIAVLTLADFLLNISLGETHAKASTDAFSFACDISKFIPSEKEIDDTTREIDFVKGFIAQNQSRFIQSHMVDTDKIQQIYGKIEFDYIYITVAALKLACKESGFNYSKVVEDLIAANFFIPSDKIPKGCKTPSNTHVKKLGSAAANCFKLVNPDDSSDT